MKDKLKQAMERDYRQYSDPTPPVALDVGRRVEVEFWCTNCSHYLYIKLNTSLDGNHIVVCPQCDHKHYRLVKNGIITGDRYNEGEAIADEIIPMKSAATKERRTNRGNIALLREMEAVGILK